MKLLKTTRDIDNLIKDVDRCRGDVILRSGDGREEYNLKSVLSRYIGIGALLSDGGDQYEIYCMEKADVANMMHFYSTLDRTALKCA